MALPHAGWRELAIEAMNAVYRRPEAVRQIDSPTFCHGLAGLLEITTRFFNDSGLELFQQAACGLTRQLLQSFDSDSAFGFRSVEPDLVKVDQPGLLDGSAGVALALLAAATDTVPSWDRVFLLA
jgi:hypothetical protein